MMQILKTKWEQGRQPSLPILARKWKNKCQKGSSVSITGHLVLPKMPIQKEKSFRLFASP
jgi:hypothetical protein